MVEIDVTDEFTTKNMRRWSRRNQNAKHELRKTLIVSTKGYGEHHARCGRKVTTHAKWVLAKNIAPSLTGSDYEKPTLQLAINEMQYDRLLQKRREYNRAKSRERYIFRRLCSAQDLAQKAGLNLEWNFYKHISAGHSYHRTGGDHAEFSLRLSGFLEALATDVSRAPRVTRLINSSASGLGFNSPHSRQEWIGPAVVAYGGPEGVEKAIIKTRIIANRILKGFGLSVSQDALRKSLTVRRRPHKAGKFAAVETLRQILSYRFGLTEPDKATATFIMARGIKRAMALPKHLRVWMADRIFAGEFISFAEAEFALPRLVENETDGVRLTLDPVSRVIKQGITAVLGYLREEGKTQGDRQWLITAGLRSYHNQPRRWSKYGNHGESDSQVAIREALEAWRRQKNLERETLQTLDLPPNVCLLISYQDSREAGNCHEGTFSFMRRIGLQPDERLRKGLPFCLQYAAGESRLRNAIQQAAKNLKQLLREQAVRLAHN